MTNTEFNHWIETNYDRLVYELGKKYPKSRPTICSDLTDAYEQILFKGPESIRHWEAWIYQFIYNRHHKFFSKQKPSYEYNEALHQLIDEEYDYEYEVLIDRVNQIICDLPIDYQNLYQLHYCEKLSGREIGKRLGLNYTGVYKQIRKMHKMIKDKL